MVAVLLSGVSPTASGRQEPGTANAREDSIAALHREGEAMFAAADYAGARNAWVDAYERIERTEQTWPYRATLLSLVVTAALAEYEVEARDDRMREVVALVQVARSTPELDPEVAAMLDTEWERLEPYAEPPSEPEVPEATPAPAPATATPRPVPPPDSQSPPFEPPRANRAGPPAAWIGAGTTILVGGIAALVVGTRFEPRARALVQGTNDSTTMSPGAEFIAAERDKGRGWVVGGSVAATVGAAALITGIALLVRSRR